MGWEGISDQARPYLDLHPKLTEADRVWRLPGSSVPSSSVVSASPQRGLTPRPSCAGVLEACTGVLVRMPRGQAGVRAGTAWPGACGLGNILLHPGARVQGEGTRVRGSHDGWAPGSWEYHSAHPPLTAPDGTLGPLPEPAGA